jgi:DNA/RNA-binding domain of Phe-tRNA-synthetase-like protein
MIKILPIVREVYPNAKFGVMTAYNPSVTAGRAQMDSLKKLIIEGIRTEHKGYERKIAVETEPVCHYVSYYKKFKKTYHVLMQLESILLKGKEIPSVGISVEAMFLAEVSNQLLTAGHDLNQINGTLTVNIASGNESYQSISGKQEQLTKNDLYLSDGSGVLSCILNGPDYRTRITDATQNMLYFVYGVDGVTVTQIQKHLEDIRHYLLTANPDVEIHALNVY